MVSLQPQPCHSRQQPFFISYVAAELLNGDNGSHNLFHSHALQDDVLGALLVFLLAVKGFS